MQTQKIGQLDAENTWLPRVRSWHRWHPRNAFTNDPTVLLSDYLSHQLEMTIPPANDLAAAQELITILINQKVINKNNCAELFS